MDYCTDTASVITLDLIRKSVANQLKCVQMWCNATLLQLCRKKSWLAQLHCSIANSIILCKWYVVVFTVNVINPWHTCAVRVTVVGLCVCLSVCLSGHGYSGTTGYGADYEWYKRLQNNKILKIKKAIFQKRLCSGGMVWKQVNETYTRC